MSIEPLPPNFPFFIIDLMFDDTIINTVYNIGSDHQYTNIGLVNKIAQVLGKEVKVEFVPDRLGHDREYGLNCLINLLGVV